MPLVKFDRIVSCSSEDPAHPSKNLLLGRDYNRKWKCKEPGEERISVIIQLSQPYLITGIDIGNDSSAFVEVLVSRTSTPDDFQVLLLMSSFMTPMDSRAEANRNRVRMFNVNDLSDSVRKEKWDRIKVVCTQPFNRHMQYGLSFLVLHTSEQKSDTLLKSASPVKALGRFALKDEDETDISVGSFFSRRKDLQSSPPPASVPPTGAAAVRDASSPANLAEQKVRKRKGSDDLFDSEKKKRGRPKQTQDSKEDASSNKVNTVVNGGPLKIVEKTPKKAGDETGGNSGSDRNRIPNSTVKTKTLATVADAGQSSSTIESPQRQQPNKKPIIESQRNITYKPFNKLLEGIEIVISGYVNPGRADIREKALQMGARYKPNWSTSSTHLICAFANTPKFNEVRGHGIIVTRDWVDDCFQERKKLSWRRYAVDKNERNDANTASEPEVWELIPGMNTNNESLLPPVSRRNNLATQDTRLGSESEDSEDEIERIRAKKNMQKKKNSNVDIKSVKDNVAVESEKDRSAPDSDHEPYNCSTDVDSEEETKSRLAQWTDDQKKVGCRDNLPPLPDFFSGKTFYLSEDLPESERQSLCRYIVAFGGKISKSEINSVHYIISSCKKIKSSEDASSICVTPDWVWECNDQQRLISPILYEPL